MYSNRIAKEGHLTHNIVTDKAQIPSAINDFFMLQENRWQGVEKGHRRSVAIRNFHQEVATNLSSFVNIYFLMIGDTRAACMYSYDFNSTRYFYWMAWDKQFESCSPGFITIINQIKDAVHKGYNCFDFMRGDEPYKYHFTKTQRINMRYFISPSKTKFKLFHLVERLSNK
jgi:CelD/BcsL family acetyltransferase involved in cellulose biosynthesis